MDTSQPPASGQRPEDFHLAVLTLGERLVEAPFTCWANLQVQSHYQNTHESLHLAVTHSVQNYLDHIVQIMFLYHI